MPKSCLVVPFLPFMPKVCIFLHISAGFHHLCSRFRERWWCFFFFFSGSMGNTHTYNCPLQSGCGCEKEERKNAPENHLCRLKRSNSGEMQTMLTSISVHSGMFWCHFFPEHLFLPLVVVIVGRSFRCPKCHRYFLRPLAEWGGFFSSSSCLSGWLVGLHDAASFVSVKCGGRNEAGRGGKMLCRMVETSLRADVIYKDIRQNGCGAVCSVAAGLHQVGSLNISSLISVGLALARSYSSNNIPHAHMEECNLILLTDTHGCTPVSLHNTLPQKPKTLI